MSNFWFYLIFWILIVIIITGVILFIVGLEAPHKDKPDNTVNYDTFKWVGVALLITGGVGMLIWLYFRFRSSPKSTLSERLLDRSMSRGSVSSYNVETIENMLLDNQLTPKQQEKLLKDLNVMLEERGMSY